MLSQKAKPDDISMVEHLIAYLLNSGQISKEELRTFHPSVCNRLDRNTSGLIAAGKTGYMSSVRNTTAPADKWIAGGIPVTMMMNMEKRHGEMKPVIQKALVKLDGAPFKKFAANRDEWAMTTSYVYPGPIQYFGPTEVCDEPTKTLQLEQAK